MDLAAEAGLDLNAAQRLAIRQGQGDAYWMAGRYKQARAAYQQARLHIKTTLDSDGLLFKISVLDAMQGGQHIPSLLERVEPFERALAERRSALHDGAPGDAQALDLIEARHYLQKGYALLIQGDAVQARAGYQHGWDLLHAAANERESRYAFDLAQAHLALGEAHLWWGEHGSSARELSTAVALCEEIGDVQGLAKSRLLRGELQARSGAWDSALAELDGLVESAARFDHPPLLAEALFRRGYVYCDRGQWAEAEADAHRGQAVAEEISDLLGQGGAYFLRNRILLRQGRAGEALDSCQALETMLRAVGSGLFLCLALRYLAWAHVGLGQPEQAVGYCEEGLDVARRAEFRREVGAIQRVWGEALFLLGQPLEAEAHLQTSRAMLAEIGCPFEEALNHLSLGRLYRDEDRPEAAVEHLHAALACFEALDACHDAAQTRALLATLPTRE